MTGTEPTAVPSEAVDAAMDTIERLGASGSRTTVKIVLEAAAPPIWRDGVRHAIKRLDQLADVHSGDGWGAAFTVAAAALWEELKIAEENAA